MSEDDMSDPTKFSRLCRFPAGLLTSIAESSGSEEQDASEINLDEIDGIPRKHSIGSRGDKARFDVDLDEFLAFEEYSLSEDGANRPTISACLDQRMREETFRKNIKNLLETMPTSHFVLLLLEPEMSIEGVYVMDAACAGLDKLWGDTPDRIEPDEVQQFWRYDVQRNQFEKVSEFTMGVDAVSM
jgi:hypothetical protein